MTEFTKNEFVRLIDLLPETDPRTNEYLTLLHSIECFDSIANSIDEMDKLRFADLADATAENVVPFTATDFPAQPEPTTAVEPTAQPTVEPEQTPPAEEKTWDASSVRKALVDARSRGVNVKEILEGFGVANFGALPASKYSALMDALEVL